MDSIGTPFKLLWRLGVFVLDDYGRCAKANTINKKKTAPNKIYKVNDFVGELCSIVYYIFWILYSISFYKRVTFFIAVW